MESEYELSSDKQSSYSILIFGLDKQSTAFSVLFGESS